VWRPSGSKRRRSLRKLLSHLFASAHLPTSAGGHPRRRASVLWVRRAFLSLVNSSREVFKRWSWGIFQRTRARASLPISRRGLASQALSPPTPHRLNRRSGRHVLRVRCQRHITKVFPGPFASLTPPTWPRTPWVRMLGAVSLASLLFACRRCGGGHVGNTRALANIGPNACGFFASAPSLAVISRRVPATLMPPAGAFGVAPFLSRSRRRSLRQPFPRRFPSSHLPTTAWGLLRRRDSSPG
jgi:hypothetical protein